MRNKKKSICIVGNHPTVVDFQSWENAYIHYLSLSEVLDEYKKVSKSWGSQKVKSLDVEEHDGEVEFVVGF